MAFVNLTPHAIVVVGGETFAPSGIIARVGMVTTATRMIEGISVSTRQAGEVQNLPPSEDGILYIVSALVRQVAESEGRRDCVSPGDLVRDESGNVVGCQGFIVGV